MRRGDRIKIFPDTDVEAYVRYFHSIGFRTKVHSDYIELTEYTRGRRGRRYTNLNVIGERIKYIRTQMFFSVNELADELMVRPSTIQAWEDGKAIPKGQQFNRFLEFSGATKEYVLYGKGEWVDEIKDLMKELHREE